MKSLSLKIVTLFAIMLICLTSFANKGNKLTADQRATIRMQKINSVCNLTTQQQTDLKQSFVTKFTMQQAQKGKDENKSLRSEKNKSKRNALQSNGKAIGSSMNKILSADQLAKWQDYKSKKK